MCPSMISTVWTILIRKLAHTSFKQREKNRTNSQMDYNFEV